MGLKSEVILMVGAGTWSNPDGVGLCWVNLWGGSAGGFGGGAIHFVDDGTFAAAAGGAGSPEVAFGLPVPTGGLSVAYVVGAKGTGGQMVNLPGGNYADGPPPTDGGDTIFGPFRAAGGRVVNRTVDLWDLVSGLGAFSRFVGQDGGGARGGDGGNLNLGVSFGPGLLGGKDSVRHAGGSGGGSGNSSFFGPPLSGYAGGPAGGRAAGADGGLEAGSGLGGGGGGGVTPRGSGVLQGSEGGGDISADGHASDTPGAGGGGGQEPLSTGVDFDFTFATGGDGMSGRIEIYWIAP